MLLGLRGGLIWTSVSTTIITGVKISEFSVIFWPGGVNVGAWGAVNRAILGPISFMRGSAGVRGSKVVRVTKEVIRRGTIEQIMRGRRMGSRRKGATSWWTNHIRISMHLQKKIIY